MQDRRRVDAQSNGPRPIYANFKTYSSPRAVCMSTLGITFVERHHSKYNNGSSSPILFSSIVELAGGDECVGRLRWRDRRIAVSAQGSHGEISQFFGQDQLM